MKNKKDITEIKHKFHPDIENHVCSMINDEVQASSANNDSENSEFEQIVDMFEGKRPVKDYEWYSNLSLKEGTSILLTDCSTAVNQYFQSRDFVEIRLEGDSPDDLKKCGAAKKCINKTLNNRRLHHYLKFARSKSINNMASHVYAVCEWEQEIESVEVGKVVNWQETGIDEFGRVVWSPVESPVMDDIIKVDRFNYDVFDPRNVFVSDEYTYSIQDKKWIIFRSEESYEDLKALEKKNGYINLDIIKELTKQTETETERQSYNKRKTKNKAKKSPIKLFDVYRRFGKIWAIIEETEGPLPSKIRPGYDKDGNILDDAVLVEALIFTVKAGSETVLIRFDPTPFIDSNNNPYRPIIRGICYPHPTKDNGLGEGELLLDMNAGIDDAFNLAFDRSKLATIPVTVSEKFAAEDNDSIYFEPGHNIAIEGGKKAIEMFQVDDKVDGILSSLGIITNKTNQVTSTFPNTMGNVAAVPASTTATAIAGAEQRTNLRQNYKALTFEYTFLVDFYWIILQMIWRFAHPKTAKLLMGEDVYFFDPDADYTYNPVTSSIETEFNKFRKVQLYQQLMSTAMQFPNQNTPMIVNALWKMILEVLGPDINRMEKIQFDESRTSQMAALMGGGGGQGSQPLIQGMTSNQSGNPMSTGEMSAREMMNT